MFNPTAGPHPKCHTMPENCWLVHLKNGGQAHSGRDIPGNCKIMMVTWGLSNLGWLASCHDLLIKLPKKAETDLKPTRFLVSDPLQLETDRKPVAMGKIRLKC